MLLILVEDGIQMEDMSSKRNCGYLKERISLISFFCGG
jgi:hypothetical protein